MILKTLTLLFFPLYALAGTGASELSNMDDTIAIQMEGLDRFQEFLGPDSFPQARPPGPVKRQITTSTITFRNPAARKFEVDGTRIPEGKRNPHSAREQSPNVI